MDDKLLWAAGAAAAVWWLWVRPLRARVSSDSSERAVAAPTRPEPRPFGAPESSFFTRAAFATAGGGSSSSSSSGSSGGCGCGCGGG